MAHHELGSILHQHLRLLLSSLFLRVKLLVGLMDRKVIIARWLEYWSQECLALLFRSSTTILDCRQTWLLNPSSLTDTSVTVYTWIWNDNLGGIALLIIHLLLCLSLFQVVWLLLVWFVLIYQLVSALLLQIMFLYQLGIQLDLWLFMVHLSLLILRTRRLHYDSIIQVILIRVAL